MDRVLISAHIRTELCAILVTMVWVYPIFLFTSSFTIPIAVIFSHTEAMFFNVDEVEYFSVPSACVLVCLDVRFIHELLFHLIVSSHAGPIEVESFSIEVKRNFIGGELTVSWGDFVDFYKMVLGEELKPNMKVWGIC